MSGSSKFQLRTPAVLHSSCIALDIASSILFTLLSRSVTKQNIRQVRNHLHTIEVKSLRASDLQEKYNVDNQRNGRS